MINELHNRIFELYRQYGYPTFTQNLPIDKLQNWSDAISKKLKISREDFYSNISDFYWSLSHVQLALGYALIAKQYCEIPKGSRGKAIDEKDIPDMSLPEMHFWHHLYCAWECIYRSWERITLIVKTACYPTNTKKMYFDGLITKLENDPKFNNNPKLRDLKKQVKHWNKTANIRNKLSHKESSPFKKSEISAEISNIVSLNGEFIPIFNYSTPNLVSELKNVKNSYLQLLQAFLDSKNFLEVI